MTLPKGAKQLQLDPVTGDIVLANGNLAFVSGLDAQVQKNKTSLAMFQGEWFLDPTKGVPYYPSILVKNPSLLVVREVFRQQLLAIQGNQEVLSLTVSLDKKTRKASVKYKVKADAGIVEGEA